MLSIKNLSISFKDQCILKNVFLQIHEQEKVAIIGDSGSGKTTLFNCILNNLKPTAGEIIYKNKNIFNFSKKEKNKYKRYEICYVSQNLDLFEEMTVEENLFLFYSKHEVNQILQKTNFDAYKDTKIKYLSGGQKQKVAIIRACLSNANLYLFDEITNALDLQTAKEVLNFLFILLKDKTIICITHQLELFSSYIETIYQIKNQQIHFIKSNSKKHSVENTQTPKQKRYHIYKKEWKSLFQHPFTLLVFIITTILTSLSLFYKLTFTSTYQTKIKKNLDDYFDQKVLTIKNYNDDLNFDTYPLDITFDSFFNHVDLFINQSLISHYTFKPIKDSNHVIFVNHQFIEENDLNMNQLTIRYSNWIENRYYILEYTYENIEIIPDNGLFSSAYLYYNYDYFKELFLNLKLKNQNFYQYLKEQNAHEYICFIDTSLYDLYQKNKNLFLFKNNPLAKNFNSKQAYFYSDALMDLFANLILYDSCKELVNFFSLFCVFGSLFIVILLFSTMLYKNFKKIALYMNMGAHYLECYFIYYIQIFLTILGTFLTLWIFLKQIHVALIFSLLFVLFIYLSILFAVIFYFEKKQLIVFLKEDETC